MDHTGFLTLGHAHPLPDTSTPPFQRPMKQPSAVDFRNTPLFRHFAKEMEDLMVKQSHQDHQKETTSMSPEVSQTQRTDLSTESEQSPTSASTLASSASEPSTAPEAKAASRPQPPMQTQTQTHTHDQPKFPSATPQDPLLGQPGLNLFDASHCSDPRYAQMVARVAAFYQQRCHAILNFQQQRCKAWAASHRQKCQESMQAAMLVVAWYIRDRIGRRRRRNKRSFRHGLREKNFLAAVLRNRGGGGRVAKGDSVRKWVAEIPEVALSPSNGSRDDERLDQEEREFDVDKQVPKDKESQLFAVADQMIKSQLAKIDVPLLGALNLDDSDCESDSDDDIRYRPEDYDMDDDDEDEDEDEEGDDYEYEDEVDQEEEAAVPLIELDKGNQEDKRIESVI